MGAGPLSVSRGPTLPIHLFKVGSEKLHHSHKDGEGLEKGSVLAAESFRSVGGGCLALATPLPSASLAYFPAFWRAFTVALHPVCRISPKPTLPALAFSGAESSSAFFEYSSYRHDQ